MGLLEAILEETVLGWADPDDADGDGISGRPQCADPVAEKPDWPLRPPERAACCTRRPVR